MNNSRNFEYSLYTEVEAVAFSNFSSPIRHSFSVENRQKSITALPHHVAPTKQGRGKEIVYILGREITVKKSKKERYEKRGSTSNVEGHYVIK